jgi:hypothetical protein
MLGVHCSPAAGDSSLILPAQQPESMAGWCSVVSNRTKALTGLAGPSTAKRWAHVQRVIKSANPITDL